MAFLRENGFDIGVDTQLQVSRLLDTLDPHTPTIHLRTLLAPLLARSPQQQQDFYLLFDRFLLRYQQLAAVGGAAAGMPSQVPVSHRPPRHLLLRLLSRRRFYVVVQLLLLAGLGYLGVRGLNCYLATRSLQGTYFCVFSIAPPPGPPDVLTPPERVLPDSAAVLPPDADPSRQRTADLIEALPLEGTGPLTVSIDDLRATWLQQYGPLFKVLVIFVLVSFFVFYEIYLTNRRRLLLLRERERHPPFFWVAHAPARQEALHKDPAFFQAGRNLRNRETAPVTEMDVDRSIEETIHSGGYAQLAFRNRTRPPEYLVLIEVQSMRDHVAHYFDQTVAELAAQGLYIERYFYTHDPRICWTSRYQEEIALEDLYRRYPEHRVLIVGEADGLLDPVYDRLAPWTTWLEKWARLVVLSPRSALTWGTREATVARRFTLLPATIEALAALPDLLEQDQLPPLRYWLDRNRYPAPPSEQTPDLVAALRTYCATTIEAGRPVQQADEGRFAWLCACALYPELSWDLTLALGQAFASPAGSSSVGGTSLYHLLLLPWFRSGEMPESLREALLQALTREQELTARRVIVRLLRDDPPPEDSFAQTEHELNLAVQEAQLYASVSHQLRLVRRAQDYALNHEIRDFTVVQTLREISRSIWRFSLPQTLNRLLFRQGLFVLGVRTGVRALMVLLAVFVVSATIDTAWVDKLETYEGERYFLSDQAARMRYETYVANKRFDAARWDQAEGHYRASIRLRQTQRGDSLRYFVPDFNLANLYWRQGDETAALHAYAQLGDAVGDQLRTQVQDSATVAGLRQLKSAARYNEGVIHYRGQAVERAGESFRDAVKIDSSNLRARFAEALVMFQRGLASQGADQVNRLTLALNRFDELQRMDSTYLRRQQPLLAVMDSVAAVLPDERLRLRLRHTLAALGWPPASAGLVIQDLLPDTTVFSPHFEYITDFVEGLALVRYQGKYGFVDAEKNLRGIQYEDARPFSEDLAAVQLGGRWGYINKDLNEVIAPQYDAADDFRDGWASVRLQGKWGTIDRAGRRQISFRYDMPVVYEAAATVPAGDSALAAVVLDGTYLYIDRLGRDVFAPQRFQRAENFGGAYARVRRWGRVYYIDRTGACVPRSLKDGRCPTEQWESELVVSLQAHDGAIDALAVSPRGDVLVSGSADGTARVWTLKTTELLFTLSHAGRVRDVAFSPDGQYIATASEDKTVKLWHTADGSLAYSLDDARGGIWAVAFAPDGRWLAAGGSDNSIRLYDAPTGRLVRRLDGHLGTISDLVFATGGACLVSASEDKTLRIWQVADGLLLQRIAPASSIMSAAVSDDSRYLAIGTRDNFFRIFELNPADLRAPARALSLPNNYQDWVCHVAFSPGKTPYLLATSYDGTARVWNLAGNTVLEVRLSGPVRAAAFSADGQYLLTANWGRSGRQEDLIRFYQIRRY
ncbi:MAG: hypothetical protein OHK0039_15690 [Bacteroidia bacterium]